MTVTDVLEQTFITALSKLLSQQRGSFIGCENTVLNEE